MIKGVFSKDNVLTEKDNESLDFYNKSRLGEINKNKIQYSLTEALYLLDKDKMKITDYKDKNLDFDSFLKKARKLQKNFLVQYKVFSDLRDRGYVVKTAFKYGAEFRVYDRGVKPGEGHAKWIVFPVHESDSMTMYEFSAKNRVAHSTKKNLLLGVVDYEGECTYYEFKWVRP